MPAGLGNPVIPRMCLTGDPKRPEMKRKPGAPVAACCLPPRSVAGQLGSALSLAGKQKSYLQSAAASHNTLLLL